MKELVILSGKGGTGKTSLTAAFAGLESSLILCDADVDAADLHLIMAPEVQETHDFVGGNEAVIVPEKCSSCGTCMDLCRFDAIDENQGIYSVDALNCEGCGVCVDLCPESAIDFPQKTCGQWFVSRTRFGPMVHARLGIAEENSGRLVTLVREQARKRARDAHIDLILTDGPPGIGCPVIASIGKFDLNPDQTRAIETIARDRNIQVAGKIPFDPAFTKAMIRIQTLLEYDGTSPAADAVKRIWEKVMAHPAMKLERLM
jgi:MinD superfamily P-loop ATPase